MLDEPVQLTEEQWRARDDARTLAHAEEIKADRDRLTNARNAASKMLKEQAKETKAIAKVANKRKRKQQYPGRPSNTTAKHNVFRRI